jgi:hypothetical protein
VIYAENNIEQTFKFRIPTRIIHFKLREKNYRTILEDGQLFTSTTQRGEGRGGGGDGEKVGVEVAVAAVVNFICQITILYMSH